MEFQSKSHSVTAIIRITINVIFSIAVFIGITLSVVNLWIDRFIDVTIMTILIITAVVFFVEMISWLGYTSRIIKKRRNGKDIYVHFYVNVILSSLVITVFALGIMGRLGCLAAIILAVTGVVLLLLIFTWISFFSKLKKQKRLGRNLLIHFFFNILLSIFIHFSTLYTGLVTVSGEEYLVINKGLLIGSGIAYLILFVSRLVKIIRFKNLKL